MNLRAQPSWTAKGRDLLVGISLLGVLVGAPSVPAAGAGAARSSLNPLAGRPLYFETNCGQASVPAQFLARGRDYQFLIQPAETKIVLRKVAGEAPLERAGREALTATQPVVTRVLRMAFAGANSQAHLRGEGLTSAKINYLVGNSPGQWRPAVATYASVCVEAIYPGINLIYYGNQQQLEYDFDVAAGADPGAIAIRFDGVDRLAISEQGELVLKLGADEIRQPRPVLYQMDGGVRKPVGGGYRLLDVRTVGFAVSQYDHLLPLVIDPVLSYSTYFGGGSGDVALAVAVDAQGFVYVAGETASSQFVTNAPGAYTNFGGGTINGDAFVAKFSNDGSQLIYFTYLGGSGNDGALGMAVDPAGNAYLAGFTDSPNFPIVSTVPGLSTHINGAPDPTLHVYPTDAFIAELNSSGSGLLYSAYVGGSGADVAAGIALDPMGNAYLTGYTASTNFPTTNAVVYLPPGATNSLVFTNLAGSNNVFVVKVAPGGSNLVYATYLGGTNFDVGEGIAADAAGRAFVTGYTTSTNFPVTTNAIQPWYAGGQDLFMAVLDPAGALLESTFLGGSGSEVGFRVALDAEGSPYVTGSETSFGFPITPGNLNPGGVYASGDAGATWTATGAGLLHNNVFSLAIDPVTPSKVYAGTGRGVARSADGGATWNTILVAAGTNNSAPAISVGSVRALALDPGTPTTLFAGTANGVFKSLDSGTNWSLTVTGLTDPVILALAVDPATPATLYAGTPTGVFKSTNGAANWNGILSVGQINALATANQSPVALYAGTLSGVYRTVDGGTHWSTFNNGLTNLNIQAIAIDPLTPSTLYAGTFEGLFKSTNSGTNWNPINSGLGSTNITALAVDPLSPATLYAGTPTGLFRSLNGGGSWAAISNGLAVTNIGALAINPQATATLFAGTLGLASYGGVDAFLTKFSFVSNSLTPVYSVVFGGTNNDTGWEVAVDPSGNAFVVGVTASTNFPNLNNPAPLQTTNAGNSDAFVTVFNADASALLYSMYLGGAAADFGYGIAADASGNAYIVGQTFSTNFPTLDAYQPALKGTSDAFVAKVVLEQPTLTVSRADDEVVLAWRAFAPEFGLESNTNLVMATWVPVPQMPVLVNGWETVTLGATNEARFFRLHKH